MQDIRLIFIVTIVYMCNIVDGYCQKTDTVKINHAQSMDYYLTGTPVQIYNSKPHKNNDSIYVMMPYIKLVDSLNHFIICNYVSDFFVYKYDYEKIGNYLVREYKYDNDFNWVKEKEYIFDGKRWTYYFESESKNSTYFLTQITVDKPFIKKTYFIHLDSLLSESLVIPEKFTPSDWKIEAIEIEEYHFQENTIYDGTRRFLKKNGQVNVIAEKYSKSKMSNDYYWYRSFIALFDVKAISYNKCKNFMNKYNTWDEILKL